MFTGKHPPPLPPNVPVGRRQAEVLRTVEQLSRLQGGRGATWTPGGLFLDQPGTDIRLGQTGSGGITVMSGSTLGHGTVTEAYLKQTGLTTVTIGVSTNTYTAFNLSASQSVAATKYVICRLMWDVWVVIWADC